MALRDRKWALHHSNSEWNSFNRGRERAPPCLYVEKLWLCYSRDENTPELEGPNSSWWLKWRLHCASVQNPLTAAPLHRAPQPLRDASVNTTLWKDTLPVEDRCCSKPGSLHGRRADMQDDPDAKITAAQGHWAPLEARWQTIAPNHCWLGVCCFASLGPELVGVAVLLEGGGGAHLCRLAGCLGLASRLLRASVCFFLSSNLAWMASSD